MAYNVGKGTGNFQFTQSGKNVLKNIEEHVKNKVKEASFAVATETLERLSNRSTNEQITPVDIYRKYYSGRKARKPRLENGWTIRARHSGSSVNYELRNRIPWASLIYSEQYSIGHQTGFRSAYPHEEKPYLYVDGEKKQLEQRPEQLTKLKWKKFLDRREYALRVAIKKALKG